jgi:hypothetical protein
MTYRVWATGKWHALPANYDTASRDAGCAALDAFSGSKSDRLCERVDSILPYPNSFALILLYRCLCRGAGPNQTEKSQSESIFRPLRQSSNIQSPAADAASADRRPEPELRKVNRSQFLGRPDSFPNIQSPTGDAGLHWLQSRCSIPKTSTFLYFSLPYYTFLRQAHDSRAMRKTGRLARQSDLPRRNSRSRLLLPLLK